MHGRFGSRVYDDAVLHRERRPWQDGHLKAGYFFEMAAGFANDPTEKTRLLRDAREFTASLLDTGYCDHPYDAIARYPECQNAKATVARLDETLKPAQ